MSVRILQPGLLTTVQDLGRFGFQKFGLSASGAMDPYAAAIANILVGNDRDCAVLECFFLGPTIQFQQDTVFSITGGNFSPCLDHQPVQTYLPIATHSGQILSFSGSSEGCRCYLAFQGGIDIPPVMGSRSTDLRAHLGGFQGRKLLQGDELSLGISVHAPLPCSGWRIRPQYHRQPVQELHVILGPQDHMFSPQTVQSFFNAEYTVTDKLDRMGCRLSGPFISSNCSQDMISDAVVYGSIQIPPSGEPILMLSDHQTVGGYPQIATVIASDSFILAQLKPGDKVKFSQTTLDAAHNIAQKREAFLAQLQSMIPKIHP